MKMLVAKLIVRVFPSSIDKAHKDRIAANQRLADNLAAEFKLRMSVPNWQHATEAQVDLKAKLALEGLDLAAELMEAAEVHEFLLEAAK